MPELFLLFFLPDLFNFLIIINLGASLFFVFKSLLLLVYIILLFSGGIIF